VENPCNAITRYHSHGIFWDGRARDGGDGEIGGIQHGRIAKEKVLRELIPPSSTVYSDCKEKCVPGLWVFYDRVKEDVPPPHVRCNDHKLRTQYEPRPFHNIVLS